jgi:hypothetical protein
MLDLGRFYTRALGEPLAAGQLFATFRGLASGVQVLGGRGFDVRGIVDLRLTNHVTIPVGRVCQRLHFLQAASQSIWGREIAAYYHVNYAGGAMESVTLHNPEEVSPYTRDRFQQVWSPPRAKAKGSIESQPAWAGYAVGPGGQKVPLYLAQTTWTLSAAHRGEAVRSITLQAGPGQCAPLVFAITVE